MSSAYAAGIRSTNGRLCCARSTATPSQYPRVNSHLWVWTLTSSSLMSAALTSTPISAGPSSSPTPTPKAAHVEIVRSEVRDTVNLHLIRRHLRDVMVGRISLTKGNAITYAEQAPRYSDPSRQRASD